PANVIAIAIVIVIAIVEDAIVIVEDAIVIVEDVTADYSIVSLPFLSSVVFDLIFSLLHKDFYIYCFSTIFTCILSSVHFKKYIANLPLNYTKYFKAS